MIKSQLKTRKKYGNQRIFYINLHQKWSLKGIYSLLKRADARGSADIIYRM